MSGAQYMFIDEADQFSLLNVEKAHRDMVGGELTFGEFLVGFLIGQAGRTDKAMQFARMRSLERFDVEYPRRIDA